MEVPDNLHDYVVFPGMAVVRARWRINRLLHGPGDRTESAFFDSSIPSGSYGPAALR